MALAEVRDVALLIRKLQSEQRAGRNHEAKRYADRVCERTMDAALLLEDAMAHCPRSRAQWLFDTDIPMKSATGQRIAAEQRRRAEVAAQAGAAQLSSPSSESAQPAPSHVLRIKRWLISRLRSSRRPG